MTANRYRAIFFDADDTLFDYPAAEREALRAVNRRFRLNLDEETFVAAYRRHNRAMWSELEQGLIDNRRLRVERFKRLFAELGVDGKDIGAVSRLYLEYLSRGCQLLAGAQELVRELARRYSLALVTNGIASVQRRRFAASPITPYFRSVVISEEVGFAKPDPRILESAMETLGVNAAEILFVGDSVSSDMACARNAGIDFCWFNPKNQPAPDGYRPRYIIQELAEILPFLLGSPESKVL